MFTVSQPNQTWGTDIARIRTREGWLHLAVALDLYSRQVVGWSMCSRIETDLVLTALRVIIWQRKPKNPVSLPSDQGCQFTDHEWLDFHKSHNLVARMSRRGNCQVNAVAERLFQLLKR